MPVYMLQAGHGGPVKIGFSKDVHCRLRKMQTDCPAPLRLFRMLDGGKKLETALHTKFTTQWIQGEWFNFTDEMLGEVGGSDLPTVPPISIKNDKFDLIMASKRAGIRGVEIAGSLGVAQSTVNRWLHRETPVPTRHIRRFAEMLKITPEQVLPPEPVHPESAAE